MSNKIESLERTVNIGDTFRPIHSGIADTIFPECGLYKPDSVRFPQHAIGDLDIAGFLMGVLGIQLGEFFLNQNFSEAQGIIASLGVGAAIPIGARLILQKVTEQFKERKLVNKYVSQEAMKRAREFPGTLSIYTARRLFLEKISRVIEWQDAQVSRYNKQEIAENITISQFNISAPLGKLGKVSLGTLHGAFLEDYDIIPFTVSQLLPDTYASRITAQRLNAKADELDIKALFAVPLQPDPALQFAEEIRFAHDFTADKEFISKNFPFFTASPMIFSGIPSSEATRDIWDRNASELFKDVGGSDYVVSKENPNYNIFGKIEDNGFTYGVTSSNATDRYDILFHLPGIVIDDNSLDTCTTVESCSALVRYKKGKASGWAVLGNYGSMLIPINKQIPIIKKAMNTVTDEVEFIALRDHSGAVGISFPDLNINVGFPPRIFGMTEQHTIASLMGAVPKQKSKWLWEKLGK